MAQINKPNQYFDTATYAGSESSQDITSLNFQPDWVWIKNRTTTPSHQLTDVVRGVHNVIYSNLTNAENQSSNQGVGAFLSNGFQVDGNIGGVNDGGSNFVAWNWLAGGTASSNTDGSITSQVSASTTSGFSIVKYSGNSTAGATVGHGLGAVPNVRITKRLTNADSWDVYHSGVDVTGDYTLRLNETGAKTNGNNTNNDTAPTSSVFTLGSDAMVNGSGNDYISYCFAEKKGFSKFGSYTGNGSTDGTFVYTGFKPAFVMVKRTDVTDQWYMIDNKRSSINPTNHRLFANLNNSESTGSNIDILSNGFKSRTSDATNNSSGGSYIYMAFAENPLVGTNNIPATAR